MSPSLFPSHAPPSLDLLGPPNLPLAYAYKRFFQDLLTGHDPVSPRVGSGHFQNLSGRVGSGQEVSKIS